jgi:hypothetical protein
MVREIYREFNTYVEDEQVIHGEGKKIFNYLDLDTSYANANLW